MNEPTRRGTDSNPAHPMRSCATSIITSAVAVFSAFTPAISQTTPPARAHHAMVYDEDRQRVLMTGGSTPVDQGRNFVFFNDAWTFDGSRWAPLERSGDRMSGMRLAFEAPAKRVISFGGYNGAALAELRWFENGAWRTIGRNADMPAAEPGFVYDARRNNFVAFGGSASQAQVHSDTWIFDGRAWTKLAIPGPSARQALAMTYDERRGRTVLFGGMGKAPAGQAPPPLGDTWEFDGSAWTQSSAAGPSPRHSAGIAYDSKRGLTLLFGGLDSTGFRGDTWAWDGSAWKLLATDGPPARAMGYLAYDRRRDRVVLFGGRMGYPNGDMNDTWEWDGERWRRAAAP